MEHSPYEARTEKKKKQLFKLAKRSTNPLSISQGMPMGTIEERRDSQEEIGEEKKKNYLLSIYPQKQLSQKKVRKMRNNNSLKKSSGRHTHRSGFNSRKASTLSKSPSTLQFQQPSAIAKAGYIPRFTFTSPQAFDQSRTVIYQQEHFQVGPVFYQVELSKLKNRVQFGFIERQNQQLVHHSLRECKQILREQLHVQFVELADLVQLLKLVEVKFGRLYLKQAIVK